MTTLEKNLKRWYDFCSKFVNGLPYYVRQDALNEINSLIWVAYCTAPVDVRDIDRYINTHVRLSLKRWIIENQGIRIPSESKSRGKLEAFKRMELVDTDGGDDPRDSVVLKDTCEAICRDTMDRNILSLVLQGYIRSEILDRLSISLWDYNQKISNIRRRLREHLQEV